MKKSISTKSRKSSASKSKTDRNSKRKSSSRHSKSKSSDSSRDILGLLQDPLVRDALRKEAITLLETSSDQGLFFLEQVRHQLQNWGLLNTIDHHVAVSSDRILHQGHSLEDSKNSLVKAMLKVHDRVSYSGHKSKMKQLEKSESKGKRTGTNRKKNNDNLSLAKVVPEPDSDDNVKQEDNNNPNPPPNDGRVTSKLWSLFDQADDAPQFAARAAKRHTMIQK